MVRNLWTKTYGDARMRLGWVKGKVQLIPVNGVVVFPLFFRIWKSPSRKSSSSHQSFLSKSHSKIFLLSDIFVLKRKIEKFRKMQIFIKFLFFSKVLFLENEWISSKNCPKMKFSWVETRQKWWFETCNLFFFHHCQLNDNRLKFSNHEFWNFRTWFLWRHDIYCNSGHVRSNLSSNRNCYSPNQKRFSQI